MPAQITNDRRAAVGARLRGAADLGANSFGPPGLARTSITAVLLRAAGITTAPNAAVVAFPLW